MDDYRRGFHTLDVLQMTAFRCSERQLVKDQKNFPQRFLTADCSSGTNSNAAADPHQNKRDPSISMTANSGRGPASVLLPIGIPLMEREVRSKCTMKCLNSPGEGPPISIVR